MQREEAVKLRKESINRNILECKFDHGKTTLVDELLVLIETYWNVNIGKLFPARLHRLQTTVGSGTRKRI